MWCLELGGSTSLLLESDDGFKDPWVLLCIYCFNYDLHISMQDPVFYKHQSIKTRILAPIGLSVWHCLYQQSEVQYGGGTCRLGIDDVES